ATGCWTGPTGARCCTLSSTRTTRAGCPPGSRSSRSTPPWRWTSRARSTWRGCPAPRLAGSAATPTTRRPAAPRSAGAASWRPRPRGRAARPWYRTCQARRPRPGTTWTSWSPSRVPWTCAAWTAPSGPQPSAGCGGPEPRRACRPDAVPLSARRCRGRRARTRSCPALHRPLRHPRVVVFVVPVPPVVGRGLGIALGRVLPGLLPPERGHVEVAPGAPQRLVAAVVEEVGAVHLVTVAEERVRAVILVYAEVGVPLVGDGVPGHRPVHPLLQARDIRLRRARGVGERGVTGVQVGQVGDLISHQGTPVAGVLGPANHSGLEEGPVDDQLTTALEQAGQARPALRP